MGYKVPPEAGPPPDLRAFKYARSWKVAVDFAGVATSSLSLQMLGVPFRHVWLSDNDASCQRMLREHFHGLWRMRPCRMDLWGQRVWPRCPNDGGSLQERLSHARIRAGRRAYAPARAPARPITVPFTVPAG